QPLHCAAAACWARFGSVLLRLAAFCGTAARLAVSSAIQASRRGPRGIRQSTYLARPHGIFISQIPAPLARLLPDTRPRVLRGRPPAARVPPGNTMNVTEEILALFQKRGDGAYFGESVSMTEHALQAAYFAQVAGAPPALTVAAL